MNIGRRLTLTLALLIVLILVGNGLVILQFERARLQTNRLTGVSQKLIAVLRLQQNLLSFHQRLKELAQSRDAAHMVTEAGPLRTELLDETQHTRTTLAYMPSEFRVDPAFLAALDTIGVALPSQLEDLTAMASAGDWDAIQLRLDNELKQMERMTTALVKSISRDLDQQLPRAVANMRDVQRRIFLIVPLTALSTVFIAAFFGWAIARRILELRLEERVGERTRIARELHDTLLQSFQGLMLRLQVVHDLLPEGKPKEQLDQTLQRGDQAIAEGRNAVHDLRSSTTATNDLAQAVKSLGDELAAQDSSAFRLVVEGPARDLHPIIRDELYRIAREALRNAFHHARARLIETEITYGERLFRLRIRDDGEGIPSETLEAGRPSHYGLPGMRERASQIGGKLDIWSGAGAGTEIEFSIAGSIAYRAPAGRPRFRLFRKKADNS